MHTLFDNLQFRVLRDRLFATLTSAEPEVEGGFDVAEDDVPAGGLGDWLQANARTGRTGLIFRGTWGRGTGELTGIALAAANDHATFVDVGPDLDVADEQALAAWLADPADAEGRARGQGPLPRDLGAGLGAGGRRQRHRAGRLPGDCRGSGRSTSATSPSATSSASSRTPPSPRAS